MLLLISCPEYMQTFPAKFRRLREIQCDESMSLSRDLIHSYVGAIFSFKMSTIVIKSTTRPSCRVLVRVLISSWIGATKKTKIQEYHKTWSYSIIKTQKEIRNFQMSSNPCSKRSLAPKNFSQIQRIVEVFFQVFRWTVEKNEYTAENQHFFFLRYKVHVRCIV